MRKCCGRQSQHRTATGTAALNTFVLLHLTWTNTTLIFYSLRATCLTFGVSSLIRVAIK